MQYVNTCPVLNVEESDRLSFMPYLFGTDFMLAELQVYALAKNGCPAMRAASGILFACRRGRLHDAGLWRVHLVSSENWFDRTVSADAAGIILTSPAINRRLAAHHDSSNPALTRLYMLRDAQLWNHITFHPECSAIYAALD